MFKDAVGDQFTGQVSNFLGESSENAGSAVGAILPSLLGSMIDKGSESGGAAGILDFLKKGNFDGSILNNVGDLLGGGEKTSGLLASGAGVLKFLLGDKLGSLVDLVSGHSGMKVGSTNTLLKMVGPLLMGVIGKYIKNKALDAVGLGNLLGSQKSIVAKSLPSGFGDVLGLGGLLAGAKDLVSGAAGKTRDAGAAVVGGAGAAASMASAGAKSAASAATGAVSDTADAAKSGFGKILPWLGLAVVALGLLWFLNRGGSDAMKDAANNAMEKTEQAADAVGDAAKNAAGTVGDATKNAADAVGDAAEGALDAIRSISLPGGAEIKATAGSFTSRLMDFLGDENADMNTAIAFDGVNFETGSAKITAESNEQLSQLAAILAAYPKMAIRIEGHTDNTGNADNNMKLSQQRALSVKNWLGQNGVTATRVAAVGRGQEKPVASNETPEGREQNRRVEVYVTSK